MAKKRGIRFSILVEDQVLSKYVCSVLLKFGYSTHKMRVRICRKGENAKLWVTQQYPEEVKAYRQRARENYNLLVGTDADELTVQERFDALAASLINQNVEHRESEERIVIWIPKWHIETWIRYLSGDHEVNENQKYHLDVDRVNFQSVGDQYYRRYQEFKDDPNQATLPSLKRSFQETDRLPL
ncbi:MAG: hypothetical protein JXB10_19815 [Pirellulales bacterium]|nr:hypothetical protein [Pirellulales bacterium]